jgi:hypothetical protein
MSIQWRKRFRGGGEVPAGSSMRFRVHGRGREGLFHRDRRKRSGGWGTRAGRKLRGGRHLEEVVLVMRGWLNWFRSSVNDDETGWFAGLLGWVDSW